jgi:hypothetical protein
MIAQHVESVSQLQRINVEMEQHQQGPQVRIRIEHYEQNLGWYPAGSLLLPLHQLPLLEQAVAEMRACQPSEESLSQKIIPFPGMTACAAG